MSENFGAAFDSLPYDKKGPGSRFMKDFEGRKRDFSSSNLSGDCEVTLRMPDAPESDFYDPEESIVTIPRRVNSFLRRNSFTDRSSSEMESFFQPVVQKIICLIEEQLTHLTISNIHTKVTVSSM